MNDNAAHEGQATGGEFRPTIKEIAYLVLFLPVWASFAIANAVVTEWENAMKKERLKRAAPEEKKS